MRHGKKFNHLGRTASHRKAMLSNMACSLIENKRINTTVAKAKELKRYVEPLITKSKSDNTHSRRVVFSMLKNKHAVAELFRDVADKVGDRPGGYTRIIKTGNRLGDNAEMCMIELVDFNELYSGQKEKGGKSKSTRRSRRRGGGGAKKAQQETATATAEKAPENKEEAKKAEPKADAPQEAASEKAETKETKAENTAGEQKPESGDKKADTDDSKNE